MYGWELTELELSSDDAFDTMEEAYEDAKNYLEDLEDEESQEGEYNATI